MKRLLSLLASRLSCLNIAPIIEEQLDSQIATTAWSSPQHGFNVGTLNLQRHTVEFLSAAATYGAKRVRVFVPMGTEELPPVFNEQDISNARTFAMRAAEAGLTVVFVPERSADPSSRLWIDQGKHFADAWAMLASGLQGLPNVVGYDLLNEPNPPWVDGTQASSSRLWEQIVELTCRAIRAVDDKTPIVIEGIAGGGPEGAALLRLPNNISNLVLSIHLYLPHEITHQRVWPQWPGVHPYPNESLAAENPVHAGRWDKQRLRELLSMVPDTVPVYVGEFSCVRWAPGSSALNYISDCIDLFAERGWSWDYHEFRGWPGWDAEADGPDLTETARSSSTARIVRLAAGFGASKGS